MLGEIARLRESLYPDPNEPSGYSIHNIPVESGTASKASVNQANGNVTWTWGSHNNTLTYRPSSDSFLGTGRATYFIGTYGNRNNRLQPYDCATKMAYAFSCIYGHFRDRQGQYRWNLNRSDAVIVDAKPLLPYAVDLLRIEYFDLLNQFVQHPGRQFPRSGVLADKTDKHICRHGTAALLLYLGAELFYFLCQFLLLVLIPAGHFGKAIIGELAGNIVLIDALKKAVQFFITGKERS